MVRSSELTDIARTIVKVKEASMSPLERFRSQVGKPLAEGISRIAQKWGNPLLRRGRETKVSYSTWPFTGSTQRNDVYIKENLKELPKRLIYPKNS